MSIQKTEAVALALNMCREANSQAVLLTPACWDLAQYVRQLEQEREAMAAVFDGFHIGSAARTPTTLLVNAQNAFRRAQCLSAIEREFFTVPASDSTEGPSEESLLRWGDEPADYVRAFEAALASIRAEKPEAVDVCHRTYAALGPALFDLAERGHPQAGKLLDNLSQARIVHADVLPFADVPLQQLPGEITDPEGHAQAIATGAIGELPPGEAAQ